MNETLETFIKRRLEELEKAEAPLRAQLAAYAAERDQLQRAGSAVGLDFGEAPPLETDGRTRRATRYTIKKAVTSVLSEFPDGLSSGELLPRINALLGTRYVRSSLSPQLSRLKADGVLDLHGVNWVIASSDAHKAEPADDEPPAWSAEEVFGPPVARWK